MNAYNQLYLDDTRNHIASLFDYAILSCNNDMEEFYNKFLHSIVCSQIEEGNPYYLSGLSGIDLYSIIIEEKKLSSQLSSQSPGTPTEYFVNLQSDIYWAASYLTYYQWFSGRRFRDINRVISFRSIVELYPFYHETDISCFVNFINSLFASPNYETNLKRLREKSGLSQVELSQKSGVNLRNIQMYEQKKNDIDKAQAQFLVKIAKVLSCNITDLLEKPLN